MLIPRNSWLTFALLSSWSVGAWAGTASTADLFQALRNNHTESLQSSLKSADLNARDSRGATPLMYAALYAGPECVKLLLDKGADPNAKNSVGATALMWGARDLAKVKLLVSKGAEVNARANSGRTALMAAAAFPGNVDVVRFLLAKGASVKFKDNFGDGAVGAAAENGDSAILKELLSRGADPDEYGRSGFTALMKAARARDIDSVRLLLSHGAKVNGKSGPRAPVKAGLQEIGEMTALLEAAPLDVPHIVRILIESGADVNAKEMRGMTPLMMAAASETQDPETVRILLAAHADVTAKAKNGESALDWARKWGAGTPIVKLLGNSAPAIEAPATQAENSSVPPARVTAEEARSAALKSLALLQKSSPQFFNNGGCVACHHQMLTGLAISFARQKGVPIDENLWAGVVKATVAVRNPDRELALQRSGRGGVPMTDSLLLVSLGAVKYPPDSLTDALVYNVAGWQSLDGAWYTRENRPPLEYSAFSETAYALRALQLYAPPGWKKDFDARIERARQWLLSARANTTEERAMQLLGLGWADADPARLHPLAKELLANQRPDGGWAQLPALESDAYATGQALTALHHAAGLPVSDPAYQRGLRFLLQKQHPDGSWLVRSRSVKFQPYFESGFPHGDDQWISAAGTAWAAIALVSSAAPPAVAASNSR